MRSFIPRSVGPWLAVLTLTAAGTAAAVGYGLTAPKRYRATAQLLVSPVSVSDPTFNGLDVLRDSGGKQTAAASAAALLRSPQVADEVRADLGLARSRDSLLHALDAHVVGSSDVVAVTVEDTSAAGAAQLANAFADGLVKQRTASFQSQLTATIRRDQQLLAQAKPSSGAAVELEKRIAVLQGFQGQPDPTLRHAGQASAPCPPPGRNCRSLRRPGPLRVWSSACSSRSCSCSAGSGGAPVARTARPMITPCPTGS